jgi:YVTN family beta-propeller protein
MSLHKTIYGNIAPKSIAYSGRDLFFAQNMMYTHSITVYDRNYNLVNTISDAVNLQQYGYPQYAGVYRGAPVEASFSHDGQYAWVSNYRMYGAGFNRPGSDQCTPAQKTDDSFLYRINTENFAIEQVVKVGSVPKYVATTPDDRYVLVTNWCTDDLSVVDVQRNREVRRIQLGRYPRGIVVDHLAQHAYVAVMGSQNIAKINLANFRVDWLKNVGRSPRHLNIDASGRYLYTSLNGEGRVDKIDLQTGKTVAKVVTGNAPRSMTLSADGAHLYVVNYESDTMAKVRTDTMQVVHTVAVNDKPIGITYAPQTSQVWVSCYSGSIMVFNG